MHHIKPGEIFLVLQSGNLPEAQRMYQACPLPDKDSVITQWILHHLTEETEFFLSQLIPMTIQTCDLAAGISLEAIQYCVSQVLPQYQRINACLTSHAADLAARQGLVEVLQYLFDHQCQITWNACIEALQSDRISIFQWLETHVPGRVYHTFQFRQGGTTFHIARYLWVSGYRPTPDHYARAVRQHDDAYVRWLIDIGCPGAPVPHPDEPNPTCMGEVLQYTLKPIDFPWLIAMIETQRLPVMEYHSESSFVKYLPELLISIEKEKTRRKLLKYVRQYAPQLLAEIMTGIVTINAPVQMVREALQVLHLTPYQMAQVSLQSFSSSEIREIINTDLDWSWVLAADLQQWVLEEEVVTVTEMIVHVAQLWEKYQQYAAQLQSPEVCEQWRQLQLVAQTPEEITRFLAHILHW
jgi:hypothetical protein|uniref:Uncharacterized protein n=1 Tax=viral metagenome TaxID=1070528 RepID=A0A6C0BKH8_9ZZZZ